MLYFGIEKESIATSINSILKQKNITDCNLKSKIINYLKAYYQSECH